MKRWILGAGVALSMAASPALAQQTDDAPQARAERALGALVSGQDDAGVIRRMGRVTLVTGLRVVTEGEDMSARARDFVARHALAFGVPAHELVFESTSTRRGFTSARFVQVHGSLPVESSALVVTLDASGLVRRVSSDIVPVTELVRGPLTAEQAVAAATKSAYGSSTSVPGEPTLTILPGGVVAWKVAVPGATLVDNAFLFVDTRDARVLRVQPTVHVEREEQR